MRASVSLVLGCGRVGLACLDHVPIGVTRRF